MRAPAEAFTQSAARPARSASGKHGKKKGGFAQRKAHKDAEDLKHKITHAEKSLNAWFGEIAESLKQEDDKEFGPFLKVRISACKERDQARRLVQYLWQSICQQENMRSEDEGLLTKD